MEKLIIDRSKWRTGSNDFEAIKEFGSGTGPTRLLNSSGYMCCLGFSCLSRGLTEEDIRDMTTPSQVANIKHKPELLGKFINTFCEEEYHENSGLSSAAMQINDSEGMTREVRESKLTELFKNEDIIVEFINQYT